MFNGGQIVSNFVVYARKLYDEIKEIQIEIILIINKKLIR